MHVSGLSPFGPIFAKELRCASRRKRNYLLRVCYLGALLLFLLLAYSITQENYGGPRGPSARMQQQEQLGQLFFAFFSMFCVCAMALIGPVLTSTAINEERLHKTFHVLLMTPITAWQIVAGKLFSRLLTAITLIGLSLPVLALVRLLGGVELQQMFGVVALCATVALASAALGLLLSVMVSRAYGVILLAYLIGGVVYAFVPMLIFSYAAATGARGAMPWLTTISNFNPFFCCGMIAAGQSRIFSANWVPCVLFHLALTAVLLALSALLVRRLARREGDATAALTPAVPMPIEIAPEAEVTTSQVTGAPPPPLPAPTLSISPPSKRRENRDVSDNPVLWRELRRPLMVSTFQRVGGTVIILALLALTYLAAWANKALDDNDTQIGFSIVFCGLVMLVACVISATAIAQEKEGDTWTVLLASPLSGADIVWGKALGAARKMLWPVLMIVVHFAVFTLAGAVRWWAFFLAVGVIVMFNTVWIASGIYLSLRCKKVTMAIIINLALPVVIYGVFSIILAVIDEFARLHGNLVEQVCWYLPFYYLGEGMNSAGPHRFGDTCDLPGRGGGVSGEAFTTVAITVGVLHLGLAVAILSWTAVRFNEIVGRASQLIPIPRLQPRANPNSLLAADVRGG